MKNLVIILVFAIICLIPQTSSADGWADAYAAAKAPDANEAKEPFMRALAAGMFPEELHLAILEAFEKSGGKASGPEGRRAYFEFRKKLDPASGEAADARARAFEIFMKDGAHAEYLRGLALVDGVDGDRALEKLSGAFDGSWKEKASVVAEAGRRFLSLSTEQPYMFFMKSVTRYFPSLFATAACAKAMDKAWDGDGREEAVSVTSFLNAAAMQGDPHAMSALPAYAAALSNLPVKEGEARQPVEKFFDDDDYAELGGLREIELGACLRGVKASCARLGESLGKDIESKDAPCYGMFLALMTTDGARKGEVIAICRQQADGSGLRAAMANVALARMTMGEDAAKAEGYAGKALALAMKMEAGKRRELAEGAAHGALASAIGLDPSRLGEALEHAALGNDDMSLYMLRRAGAKSKTSPFQPEDYLMMSITSEDPEPSREMAFSCLFEGKCYKEERPEGMAAVGFMHLNNACVMKDAEACEAINAMKEGL